MMFRHYLKSAVRAFLRYRQYTVINLLGLTIGVCCCALIGCYVREEFSYDGFHRHAGRLYRAWMTEKDGDVPRVSTITALPLGPALQRGVGQVEYACRVYKTNLLVGYEGHAFNEIVHLVDPSFFSLFDFELRAGDIRRPWPDEHSVVVSETVARKYFGGEQAVGKQLEIQIGDGKELLVVSGVVADAPPGSSIRVDVLLPFSYDRLLFNERMRTTAWSNIFTETYVLLKDGVTAIAAEKGIAAMTRAVLGVDYAGGSYTIGLQPIRSIHLDDQLPPGIEPVGNAKYVLIAATIGILILLIACINFVILSIGYSTARAKEVGVRKVLGAEQGTLIRQFWGESFLLSLLAVGCGIGLARLLTGPFGNLIGETIEWRVGLVFWSFVLATIVMVGVISGIYPAVVLARFRPIEVLKGRMRGRVNIGMFRKGLIVGQFAVSIAMIGCTLIVGQQLRFVGHAALGFDKEHVVVVRTNAKQADGIKLAALYKHAVLKLAGVADASEVMYGLDEAPWAEMGFTDGKGLTRTFQFNSVDASFLSTMRIDLVAGSNYFSDSDRSVLVNQAFVREFGLTSPVGKALPGPFGLRIRGVVPDVHVESLHTAVKPLVLATGFDDIAHKTETMLTRYALEPKVMVRLRPGDLHRQIEALQNAWRDVAPEQGFDLSFLDEALGSQYQQDRRTGAIVNWAAAFSVLISCMGLFGLMTLSVGNRIREIAIRKVLGASVVRVLMLLSRDFLRLVGIAALIGLPLAWLTMNYWLHDFAYRVALSSWVFVLAIGIVIAIAFGTMCLRAIGAARANPVKGMRNE